jgi:LmbE family N-acetylglucosaminyl deacetylase
MAKFQAAGRIREAAEQPTSKPSPTFMTVPATSTHLQASRIAALQAEINSLGNASLTLPQAISTWWTQTFPPQAPFAVVKRKMSRFRLPRLFKTDLIDRFCAETADSPKSLTTLIVVAHPDDESIGAGARLRHLGDAYVVNVTDGSPRDPGCARRHGFASREDYAEARRRELLNALAVAGMSQDRLICFDFVDGEATLRLAELCLKITELLDTLRPDVVLTHPYEGGHTDHDATAFAVHLACGVLRREGVRPPAVLEFTSYHARNGEKVIQEFLPHEGADQDQRTLQLSESDRELKQRIFDCFESQSPLLENFNTHFERYRPAPRYNFTRAPHAGQLNYERYGSPDRGKSWREHAERALRTLRMRDD